jgi:hypothetical protein
LVCRSDARGLRHWRAAYSMLILKKFTGDIPALIGFVIVLA